MYASRIKLFPKFSSEVAKKRIAYDFDAIDDSGSIDPFSFSSGEDFLIEADINITQLTGEHVIIGQESTDNWYLSIRGDNLLHFSGVVKSLNQVEKDKWISIKIERVSSLITMHIDDVEQESGSRSWNGYIDSIGRNVYGLFFGGIIKRLRLKNSTSDVTYTIDNKSDPIPNGIAKNFNDERWVEIDV